MPTKRQVGHTRELLYRSDRKHHDLEGASRIAGRQPPMAPTPLATCHPPSVLFFVEEYVKSPVLSIDDLRL